ncbi:helix-turn-helix domain-containing protein [Streptomyces sp. H27-D2]|uniref:helix-turn-helix domain-containing protein n=1 Tax=Streptomyces sp. H27-D2 TaxID=3046304 RepID=UPI002DB8F4BA|nr:helix-turn-helix domain-containing protein [Streptomyces sp. H27-D2]MEC4016039.1 helix-turn-helix domain-containing protein [Streptomyces sp. H27-D2]
MSVYLLDVPELHRRLDARRTEQGLSWRQLALHLDVSPSTLSRIGDGLRPDVDALVSLLVWLDLDTDIAYLIKPKEPTA